MRDIKFRGKSLLDGSWVYGDLYTHSADKQVRIVSNGGMCPVDKNTVGQYTGLKDKNGKEIYEGDIMKFEDAGYLEVMTGKVEYEYHWAQYFIFCKDTNDYHPMNYSFANTYEVIGNIYDNPELIKDGNTN